MPLLSVSATDLVGPLLNRRTSADDYTVMIEAGDHGRLTVGRIFRVMRASGSDAGQWLWTVTGPAAPNAGIELSGDSGSLEEARLAFRAAFDRLIAWAASTALSALPWHVPAQRVE